jgi:hypothetical protein
MRRLLAVIGRTLAAGRQLGGDLCERRLAMALKKKRCKRNGEGKGIEGKMGCQIQKSAQVERIPPSSLPGTSSAPNTTSPPPPAPPPLYHHHQHHPPAAHLLGRRQEGRGLQGGVRRHPPVHRQTKSGKEAEGGAPCGSRRPSQAMASTCWRKVHASPLVAPMRGRSPSEISPAADSEHPCPRASMQASYPRLRSLASRCR